MAHEIAAGADGAVYETGIAGMTLGGSSGGRMRQYGLAGDYPVAADVVTAEGAVITANATAHPDLFWALGGGIVAVVHSMECFFSKTPYEHH